MNRNLSKKTIKNLPYILFSSLFLLSLSWFFGLREDQFLYIHDQSPFMSEGDAISSLNVWSRDWLGSDGGMGLISGIRALRFLMFSRLGFSFQQAEMIYFSIIFTLPAISMFILIRTILRTISQNSKEDEDYVTIASSMGALLYSINLYLIILWHAGHYTNVGFLYALFPLVLVQLWKVQFNHVNSIVSGIKAGLFFILIGPLTPPNMLALVAFSFIVFLMVSFFISENKKTFLNVLLTLVIIVLLAGLLNAWWSLTYFKTLLFTAKDFINAGDKSISYISLVGEPPGLIRRFMLFMKWTIDGAWHGRYFHSFFPYYQYSIVKMFWSIVLVFSFTALFHRKWLNNISFKFIAIFSTLLFALSVLFAKGIRYPFPNLFIFLFENVPLFNMFRSPGNKFGSGLVFGLSILLGLSTYTFLTSRPKDKTRNCTICFLIAISILIYGYPLLTGVALKEQTIGRMPSNVTSIPDEYERFASLVNGDEEDFRILFVPGKIYGGYKPNEDLESGYEGPDMLEKLLNKPSIHRPVSSRTTSTTATVIWELLDHENYELLKFLNVKYIAQRCDVINYKYSFVCNKEIDPKYGRYLEGYKTVKPFELYQEYYSPKFSFVNNVKSVQDTEEFFDVISDEQRENLAYVVESQNKNKDFPVDLNEGIPDIEYEKVSNSRYIIKAKNVKGKSLLVSSEGYHRDWKLYTFSMAPSNREILDNLLSKSYSQENNHYIVNGFANGWVVDADEICNNINCTEENDHEKIFYIVLDFWPNWLVLGGLVVSASSLVLALAILFIIVRKKRI